MTVSLHDIVIDAHDLPGAGSVLESKCSVGRSSRTGTEVVIGTDVDAPVGICLMPAGEEKSVKNRVHLDLNRGAADPEDREAEIQRIIALGARHVDIRATGDESWTVLADPRATSSASSDRSGR